MSNYSKYKEKKPKDTVFEIQSILNGIGLFPVLRWNENSYEGARSCRLTIWPTELGVNGKGTDEEYASASAYAELMERLSNGIISCRDRADKLAWNAGFREFPDEKNTDADEFAADPDPLCRQVLPKLGFTDEQAQREFLRSFADAYADSDGTIPLVPFADPSENKIRWLSPLITQLVVGSNGMAAGNTLEEAMVQGLSEVFERAASERIISGGAVPPEIPDDEVKEYSFYPLIRQIRDEGRYSVKLLDCSMGRGWPVAGLLITDTDEGTFGLKLGAHPSLAVAIERTLTEALQGKSLRSFVGAGRLGDQKEADGYHNATNIAKTGYGIYPYTLFTEEPGWDHQPWTHWEGLDNRSFLKLMLRILKEEGLSPLIRDCSFLGFPSCAIVVPGFSEIYRTERLFVRSLVSSAKAARSFDHFPDLSEDEEKRLLKVIRFKEGSYIENQISFISCRPLSDSYHAGRIGAYLSLKYGEYKEAQHFFRACEGRSEDEQDKRYYSAMAKYAGIRETGCDSAEAQRVIRSLFREDIAEAVCTDAENIADILKLKYPRVNCYDCGSCPIAGNGCNNPALRDVLAKTAHAMKAERVDQEALLRKLRELYAEIEEEAAL